MCEQYNGYTNYQTWNVSLWIDNSEGDQEYWAERAADLDFDVPDLARELQDYHEENMPGDSCGVYADLLGNALAHVNWYEIAEGIIEYAKELDV